MRWIAESPFAGGSPYLLRSTTYGQLIAKGGTLGWRTVAARVFTAFMQVAATLADFLKALQLVCMKPETTGLLKG